MFFAVPKSSESSFPEVPNTVVRTSTGFLLLTRHRASKELVEQTQKMLIELTGEIWVILTETEYQEER